MTTLLSLLSAYYLCDAAAMQTVLSHSEAQRCAQVFTAVKAEFATPDAAGLASPDENTTRYRAFKAWEAENAELVTSLKQDARSRLPTHHAAR